MTAPHDEYENLVDTILGAGPSVTGDDSGAPDRVGIRDKFLTLEQLRNLPPTSPLIKGMLDLDSLAIIYGPRGSYKSFITLDWAMSVACGTRWNEREVTQGKVVYIAAEGVSGLGVRFDAWLNEHPFQSPSDRLYVLPQTVSLLAPATIGELAEACAEVEAKFVVIDTLARCLVGGDENSNKDAGLAVEQLDSLRRKTGACVLLVHHSGKNKDNGARGASAFEAAVDSVFEVVKDDDAVTINCTKQKNHAESLPIHLTAESVLDSVVLRPGGVRVSKVPRGVLETLRALDDIDTGTGSSATAWQVSAPSSEGTFYRHRKDLIALGLVENAGTEKNPRYKVTDSGRSKLKESTESSESQDTF